MRPLPKTKAVKDKAVKRAEADALENVIGLTKSSEPPAAGKTPRLSSEMDQKVRVERPKRRALTTGFITALLLAGSGTAYVVVGLNSSQAVQASRVALGAVELGRFGETIPVNANVIPEDTVFLDTVEGGRVMTLHVEDGAAVSKGTSLVTLKNSNLELQVIGREAQYTQQLSNLAQSQMAFDQSQLRYDQQLMDARLQIDLTKASLQRRLPIEETGVSQSEIDRLQAELIHQEASYELISDAKARDTQNANRNLNQLRQSISRMEDSVDIMRESLEQLTLRAPIDGRVSAMTVQPGQYLPPGSRIGQVDVAGAFKLRAFVNEFYLSRLSVSQSATADIGSQTYELSVAKIYPTISDRLFEVDLNFTTERPENLRRGQSVRIKISMGDESDTLTIPSGSYETSTGGQWVFVVSPDGQSATRRNITTGRKGSDRIEVLSGLSEGETILTSSYDIYAGREHITFKH